MITVAVVQDSRSKIGGFCVGVPNVGESDRESQILGLINAYLLPHYVVRQDGVPESGMESSLYQLKRKVYLGSSTLYGHSSYLCAVQCSK